MDSKAFKEIFDPQLDTYIAQKILEAQTLLGNNELNSYLEYIKPFVFSGGKRIRPYCLRLIYKGFTSKLEEDVLKFGIVFELLHTMALIHDDIIDQSDKRHNVATVHKFISRSLGGKNDNVAEGQAMLIGDLLLSRVYELVNSSYQFDEIVLQKARQNVHAMIEEVILGQMIDVQMMTGKNTSKAMIEKKNMYKTASYTFTRPMLTGAILAGVSRIERSLIVELGNTLGLAFQIKDDLMDITCGDKTKSLFSDIQEGQQTYFTQYIKQYGNAEDKILLTECMGKDLEESQIVSLQNMFARTKAIDAGIIHIHKYTKKARALLKKISFKDKMAYEGLLVVITKIEQI